ncbi:hypothetical protein H5P28_17135 [Ruficoccus amylovorans]|uniref:LamG domain-containing protein n=1 Tax=Ruficoccus amylovorans TaxID=1804625 RepID=A0A842HHJ0_9BACT|nr:LamG-like jellyroll fold domain-containing protein [Ruficoccus amylovorans]MBC2595993.1 hypothetical protein [Ruficoccus amylovorans]
MSKLSLAGLFLLQAVVAGAAEPYASWKLDGSYAAGGSQPLRMGPVGTPSFDDAGVSGKCVRLDNAASGQGMRVVLGEFRTATDLTFTAWVRFTTQEGGFSDTAPHNIVRFWGKTPEGQAAVLDLRVRDGVMDVYYTNPARNLQAGNLAVPVGQWVFVAVVVEGDSLSIVLNDARRSFPIAGPQSYETMTVGTVAQGSRRGVNGWMDEVSLYDEALSPEELGLLYRQGREALANGAGAAGGGR